jgi:large subunit ribosomal protein L24
MERKYNTQPKLKIRKGDTVKVIAGDSKGQQGKVLSVSLAKSTVVVEGVNMVTKHMKPNAQNTNGGIIKVEAPLNVSNVMLVDPKSGAATRVGRKLNSEGKLVRFAKKSGEEIK